MIKDCKSNVYSKKQMFESIDNLTDRIFDKVKDYLNIKPCKIEGVKQFYSQKDFDKVKKFMSETYTRNFFIKLTSSEKFRLEGFISISDCCRFYNVDRKTFDSYCKIFNIETKQENNNTYISDNSKEWFDRLFSSYTKEDIKAMMLSKIKPFSCEGITYLSLRKELNLTLKQFINKISHIGLVLKSNYTKDEENKIREFCSNGMNKAELRELDYVNQGWISLRKVLNEVDISSGTLDSYVKILNIEVYKPSSKLSFISKEDKEKILNFINEHKDPTERKIYLSEQTCLKKFGVENGAKPEEVRKIISQKSTENAKERLEKAKQTNLDKYGVSCTFLSKELMKDSVKKSKKTKIEKYGTLSINHRYEYDNIYFDSSWEIYFYIYHKDILNDDVSRGKVFEYEFENKIHHYECDFVVDNENIEIKGSQYLDKYNNLIFPYTNDKKVDSDKMQRLWSAKSKCMKDNNVKIVSENEINKIIKIVDEKFTKNYVSLFELDLDFPYINEDFYDKSDMGVIRHFHKSIYHANRNKELSPFDAWNDKNLIKKCALNRLKYIGSCLPTDIIQGFNVSKIAPKVSVFKPKLAEDLLRKYCTTDFIFDPFSGFSGRMIGTMNLGKSYYGQDINKIHVEESNEIIKYKNYKNCEVVVQDIFTDNNKDYSFATLFTCSPYSLKEQWNENETDKSCDEWIDICLEKYKCKEYIFIVDETEKYKDYIVETIENKSHFGVNNEYVIYIKN